MALNRFRVAIPLPADPGDDPTDDDLIRRAMEVAHGVAGERGLHAAGVRLEVKRPVHWRETEGRYITVPVAIFTAEGTPDMKHELTKEQWADIFMANEMYQASPDGQADIERFTDSLGPPVTIEISGHFCNEGCDHE